MRFFKPKVVPVAANTASKPFFKYNDASTSYIIMNGVGSSADEEPSCDMHVVTGNKFYQVEVPYFSAGFLEDMKDARRDMKDIASVIAFPKRTPSSELRHEASSLEFLMGLSLLTM